MDKQLKAYCGYLKGKTPMQAARISAQLDKHTCYNIYDKETCKVSETIRGTEAECVLDLIFNHKCTPNAREMSVYKRGGNIKKEIVYALDCKDFSFFELKKTVYNYAVYLYEYFQSFESALGADNAEFSRLEAERLEAEKKALEEEEREKAQEAAEAEFNQKLANEAAALVGTKIHDLTKSILNTYSWYNGATSTDIRFMKLYVMAQNIENPLAKAELRSLLHNDNKASIRLFSTFSGVKMPSSHKERCDIINGLKQSDIRHDEVNILEATHSA